jgi:hypothetical protein
MIRTPARHNLCEAVLTSSCFAITCNPASKLLESLRRRPLPLLGYVQLAAAQFSAGSPLLRSVWDFNYHILSVQTPGGCCTK